MGIKRLFFTFLTLILTTLFTIPLIYGLFNPKQETFNFFKVGLWDYLYDELGVTEEGVNDYIDLIYPEDDPLNDFIKDSIFDEDGELLPIFDDYTMGDILDLIDIIDDFQDQFMSVDPDGNGTLNPAHNPYVFPAEVVGTFVPGESRIIPFVIHTGDLGDASTFEILLTIKRPGSTSIQDFAAEILFDQNVFEATNSFTYTTQVANLSGTQSYTHLAYRPHTTFTTKYKPTLFGSETTYTHSLATPDTPGNWSRFYLGPNYYTQSLLGLFGSVTRDTPADREGAILVGRSETNASITIRISNRNYSGTDTHPIIPIFIHLSRGTPGTNSTAYQPTVEFSIIRV